MMKRVVMVLVMSCLVLAVRDRVAAKATELMRIPVRDGEDLRLLRNLRIDPLRRGPDYVEAKVDEAQRKALAANGFQPVMAPLDREAERQLIIDRSAKGYHTFESLEQELYDIAAAHPDITRLIVLGESIQGRDLLAIKISDNPAEDEIEPEIKWDATIHGDEKIAQEVAMFIINLLVDGYGSDPDVTYLVDNREIWIFPCVNPDGMVAATRENAAGVDCNRDYGYKWNSWGASPAPFSQPETQAARLLLTSHQFVIATSFHSGTEYISFPWSFTWDATPDNGNLDFLQNAYTAMSGYPGDQGSHGMYYINGASKDAGYGIMGTLDWVIELSNEKTPPASQIDYYCGLNNAASLYLIEQAGNGIGGIVTDAITGEPVPAIVEVVETGWPVYADPVVGDYHRYARPGTYTLRVWANDYEETMVYGVVVPAVGAADADVELERGIASYIYRVEICDDTASNDNNHTMTAAVLGPPDDEYFSLGVGGYLVVDMGPGTPIVDSPGDDFTVYEASGTAETCTVYVAADWRGPWFSLGACTGTGVFDLSASGLEEARYVKVVDDGDGSAGAADPGYDLDAIYTEHVIPSCGRISLDSQAYSCGGIIQMELQDIDLNLDPGVQNQADVHVASDTDPVGFGLSLVEIGTDTGVFSGSLELCVEPTTGALQVTDGDAVTIRYEDADCDGQPQTVIETAGVDCAGPVITGITVVERSFDAAVIEWITDEPADSTVVYGATTPPAEQIHAPAMTMVHQVTLSGLEPCTTYHFWVASSDLVGNGTVDDNGGYYYPFITMEVALLMDETMDSNPGWTISGGQWAWGQPTGGGGDYGDPDPSAGHTGANVYGYNLNGDYGNNIPAYHLTTPPMNCTGATGVSLDYYRWLGVESNSWDNAVLAISTNGGSWTEVYHNPSTSISDGAWVHREYDLSDQADGQPAVYLRWTMGSADSSVVYCGWNIDDVRVYYTQECQYTPTITPTRPPTRTPTPSSTITPTGVTSATPVGSPTPACDATGVQLLMPAHHFQPGQSCWLAAVICNDGPVMTDMPVFIALNVADEYWFAPSWRHIDEGIDHYTETLAPGETPLVVIGQFMWPEITDTAEGLLFIGLITDPAITTAIGEIGYWEFGYGP